MFFRKQAEDLLGNIKIPRHYAELKGLLQDYQFMVAEFKVSLFAQELKTIIPVSAKRLEQKWQEINEFLC